MDVHEWDDYLRQASITFLASSLISWVSKILISNYEVSCQKKVIRD